jgi:hypothetical protein
MKYTLILLILFSVKAHASELVILSSSLDSISCALLVTVTSFNLKDHFLKGSIKKTWGKCKEEKDGWSLWRAVEWSDPDVSPIEERTEGTTLRRDFKVGEDIILIYPGWETLEGSAENFNKLEFIFNSKQVLAKLLKDNNQEEMANLLSLENSSQKTLHFLIKEKKMTINLALKASILAQKKRSGVFIENFLKVLNTEKDLQFFEVLTKSDEYKNLNMAPSSLVSLIQYSIQAPQKLAAWKILVTHFSNQRLEENECRVTFFNSYKLNEFLKNVPLDRNWYLVEWLKTISGTGDTLSIDSYWDLNFTTNDKKFLTDHLIELVKNYETGLKFYDKIMNVPFFDEHPRYLESLSVVWSDHRFYLNEPSKSYFLIEKTLKIAQNNPKFIVPLSLMNVVALASGQKFPFQGEIDKLLWPPLE